MSDVTDLAEVEFREKIKAEIEAAAQKQKDADIERDKAVIALAVTAIVSITFLLPLLALVCGLSVRLFCWASGM